MGKKRLARRQIIARKELEPDGADQLRAFGVGRKTQRGVIHQSAGHGRAPFAEVGPLFELRTRQRKS